MSAGWTDWKVGDLAVVVKTRKRRQGELRGPHNSAKVGSVHTVVGVVMDRVGTVGLVIQGKRSAHPTGAFAASGFRKVVKDREEPCESEFVDLLKRSKRSVEA